MFLMIECDIDGLWLIGCDVEVIVVDIYVVKYDFILIFEYVFDGMEMGLEYNIDLFDVDMVDVLVS